MIGEGDVRFIGVGNHRFEVAGADIGVAVVILAVVGGIVVVEPETQLGGHRPEGKAHAQDIAPAIGLVDAMTLQYAIARRGGVDNAAIGRQYGLAEGAGAGAKTIAIVVVELIGEFDRGELRLIFGIAQPIEVLIVIVAGVGGVGFAIGEEGLVGIAVVVTTILGDLRSRGAVVVIEALVVLAEEQGELAGPDLRNRLEEELVLHRWIVLEIAIPLVLVEIDPGGGGGNVSQEQTGIDEAAGIVFAKGPDPGQGTDKGVGRGLEAVGFHGAAEGRQAGNGGGFGARIVSGAGYQAAGDEFVAVEGVAVVVVEGDAIQGKVDQVLSKAVDINIVSIHAVAAADDEGVGHVAQGLGVRVGGGDEVELPLGDESFSIGGTLFEALDLFQIFAWRLPDIAGRCAAEKVIGGTGRTGDGTEGFIGGKGGAATEGKNGKGYRVAQGSGMHLGHGRSLSGVLKFLIDQGDMIIVPMLSTVHGSSPIR